jgi:hypothetical protein
MKLNLALTVSALACFFSSCAQTPPVYIEDHRVTIQQRPRYQEPKYTPVKRNAPEDFRAVETAN